MRLPAPFLRSTCLLALLAAASAAQAGPAIGFIETFPGTSTSTWLGGAEYSNPGTGGVGGAGDGYLRVARSFAAQLATRSDGLEYNGDWTASNVDKINLCLNDVDADQPLEIHVCVGNSANFWIYKTGFSPPEHAWGPFTVDLSDSTKFAHLIAIDGKGFAFALQHADRLHVRHETLPFAQSADAMLGEFGLDNVELTNSAVGVGPMPRGVVRPVELAAPFPNPARGAVACAFDTFDESPVRVLVVDALGRVVRSESLSGAAPGRRTWVWNGLDDAGRVAPAGAYRVRVSGSAGGSSRPFIRVN